MKRTDFTIRGGRIARAFGVALAAATVALALPTSAEAQVPAPWQSRPVALVGGTIHPISGPAIPNGTLVFENGVITAIGASVQIPEGAERVDVSGKHIYPGLIDAWSQMGLFEIGGFDVAIDTNELGDLNPNVRAAVAFHAESRHIGTTRSNGVLVTNSSPGGGLVSGMSSAMMLDGWTWEQMTIKAESGLIVNWPNPGGGGGGGFGGGGGGPGGGGAAAAGGNAYANTLNTLRQAFADARAYRVARQANAPGLEFDARWEAMLPVIDGEIPVLVSANDVRQMQDAITWAEEEGLRIVLIGGRDAGFIAEYLAAKQVPVLLTSVLSAPSRQWASYDDFYTLPARLHAAGVRFGITGGSSAPYANRLPYEAGVAIAHGLPEIEAIRSLTLYPAQFLGIDDRVGSLEVGKDATLLITTGNPLEYASTVEQAFIQGRDIDLMDMHRQFYEKYSEKIRQLQGRPVF
jgi:imidazolonepropionase-like amidohydrolase